MATSNTDSFPFADIQGVVFSGYGHLSHACYLFMRVEDATKARAWLRDLIPAITDAVRSPKGARPTRCTNIAFSAAGLAALGLPDPQLKSFSPEFQEGPAEQNRAWLLGDVGASDPTTWDYGGPTKPPLHILLMMFADGDADRDAFRDEHRARLAAGGLSESCTQNGYRTVDSHEHFGFFDGISQPAIRGLKEPTPADVAPGEILCGYVNEYGLPARIPGSDALGKNGTYMVYRKLSQEVKGFNDFLTSTTDGSAAAKDYLGAKMVGRWKSGAPITLAPDADDPTLGADLSRNNAFLFAADDKFGDRCPVGAHIRRANPRDSLEPNPDESMKTVKRHSIIRRGRSYGALYDGTNPEHPRGLLFICLNADIKRQFEFMQQAWINDPHFAGLYDNKDPLVADRDPKQPHTVHTVPGSPFNERVKAIPQFVTMRGGGYFFVPGMAGLRYLSDL